MKRFLFSTLVSAFTAALSGVSLAYCLSDTPIHHHEAWPLLWAIILSANLYALVLNCIFYIMKLWGRFYLKRQGLIVTTSIFIITAAPIYFLSPFFSPELRLIANQYVFSIMGELAIIGFVGTSLLKNERLSV